MTTLIPVSMSYDLKFMYHIPVSKPEILPKFYPNSLTDVINTHKDFRKFKYILNLSGMEQYYNDLQSEFTIFVPSDVAISNIPEEIFLNMDKSTARAIVKTSTLKRRIPSELLEDSPASYFETTDPVNRIFISNISGRTMINNCINVVHKDMMAENGIIHVIDKLIEPLII